MAISNIKSPDLIPKSTNGDLEEKKLYGKERRKDKEQQALHYIFLVFVWAISIVGIATIGIRIAHLALPAKFQWLTIEQIQGIDKIFFSGAVGGFIVNYFKKTSETNI